MTAEDSRGNHFIFFVIYSSEVDMPRYSYKILSFFVVFLCVFMNKQQIRKHCHLNQRLRRIARIRDGQLLDAGNSTRGENKINHKTDEISTRSCDVCYCVISLLEFYRITQWSTGSRFERAPCKQQMMLCDLFLLAQPIGWLLEPISIHIGWKKPQCTSLYQSGHCWRLHQSTDFFLLILLQKSKVHPWVGWHRLCW